MNFNNYREIKPKVKIFKKIYVSVVLFFFGRAFQAVYAVDKVAKAEFDSMPDDFVFDLCALPDGPHMIIGKNDKGKIKYLGWNPEGKKITLSMNVKGIEAIMLMFTFQESTCVATARDRVLVDGDIPTACGIVRMLDLLEILLLPKIAAKLGVKRYPTWSKMSPIRKYISRVLVYIRIVTG